MAASIKHVRVKLSVKKTDKCGVSVCPSYTIWHAIDFEKHRNVQSLLAELSQRFDTDINNTSLWLQNVVIPDCERCSHIFREDDDIE